MKVNEVVFKNGKIKSEQHFITHSNYIEKDDAEIIKQISDKEMLEIINMNRERLNQKKGKRGKPPRGFQNMIFSVPPDVDEKVRNMSFDEKSELVNSFMETIYRDIEKLNHPKKLDMDWVKKHTKIVCHNDTEHVHFHILLPKFAFVKSSFNVLGVSNEKKEFVSLDYANKMVSSNARHKMFNRFNSMLNQVQPMSEEEFKNTMYDEKGKKIELVNSGKMKKFQDGMKGKKQKLDEEVEKRLKKILYHLEQMEEQMAELVKNGLNPQQVENLGKFRKHTKRVRTQFQNGKTDRGEKTYKQVVDDFKSLKPS